MHPNISIIVCSRSSSICNELSASIQETIGCSYELIHIDNSCNNYSIFQAYEQGVLRSNGDVLCFIHEDILFRSQDWGAKIVQSLQNTEIGLVGVLGGKYIDECSTSWMSSSFYAGQIEQMDLNGISTYYNHNSNEKTTEVTCVDGVLLACRAEMFQSKTIAWDTTTYKGFHFYDMDISMQVLAAGLKILTIPEVLICHKSSGVYNKSFYDACMQFHSKWDYLLPISTADLNNNDIKEARKSHMRQIYRQGIVIVEYRTMMQRLGHRIIAKLHLLLK